MEQTYPRAFGLLQVLVVPYRSKGADASVARPNSASGNQAPRCASRTLRVSARVEARRSCDVPNEGDIWSAMLISFASQTYRRKRLTDTISAWPRVRVT